MNEQRHGHCERRSRETQIECSVCLDGSGKGDIHTGIGFFDHMLEAMSRFARMDVMIRCQGDLDVDGHHTVEDTGICLGRAIREALGDRSGIVRAAHAYMPMDEALAFCVIDISGRPYLAFDASFDHPMCGGMDTQLAEEFFRALAVQAGLTVHMRLESGRNDHHRMEALFKAFGLALHSGACRDSGVQGVLSTKGLLD